MVFRRICGILLPTLVGILSLVQHPAWAQGIAGSYAGRYQCREWNRLDLQVRDLGGGRISAVFIFPATQNRGRGEGSYAMTGQIDERTGRFHLAPQAWLTQPSGYNMVGLEGVFDSRNRTLRGRVESFNCAGFELAPQGVALAGPPLPARPLPPERGKTVVNLANFMPNSLEYWDASMDDSGKARESEPIDDVIDWLKSQKFSCLGTQRVSWNTEGTQGAASDRVDVRERYVIECDGNCSGLHYMPNVQATIFHFAATQSVPVMEFKGTWFGGTNFQWKFTRTNTSTPPPQVFIHRWSNANVLSGQSCRAPTSKNR